MRTLGPPARRGRPCCVRAGPRPVPEAPLFRLDMAEGESGPRRSPGRLSPARGGALGAPGPRRVGDVLGAAAQSGASEIEESFLLDAETWRAAETDPLPPREGPSALGIDLGGRAAIVLAVAEGVRRDAGPQPRPAWRALTERTSLWNQLLRLAFRIRCPIPTRPGAWQYKRSPRSGGVASLAVPSFRVFGAVVGVNLAETGHERPRFARPGLLAPDPSRWASGRLRPALWALQRLLLLWGLLLRRPVGGGRPVATTADWRAAPGPAGRPGPGAMNDLRSESLPGLRGSGACPNDDGVVVLRGAA